MYIKRVPLAAAFRLPNVPVAPMAAMGN